jgi:predicted cupin superfamily sugar epimerase
MATAGYNFSERVRKVLARSRKEAERLGHEFVGTEHILLGLLAEGEGVAAAVLQALNVDTAQLRSRIEAVVKRGEARYASPDLPYTSRAKKVLELSMASARTLRHNYVGTEHLLLGLIAEGKAIAAAVLAEAGLTNEVATAKIMDILGTQPGDARTEETGARAKRSYLQQFVSRQPDSEDSIISRLGLAPHPEGGHYKEVYRSPMRISANGRERSAVTTIYYFLRKGEISRWHVVQSDEIWHAYAATDFELLDYNPITRQVKSLTFGADNGPMDWVHAVPAGNWQAAVARKPALMGCTVAPGFDFADFSLVRNVAGHEKAFEGELREWRGLL